MNTKGVAVVAAAVVAVVVAAVAMALTLGRDDEYSAKHIENRVEGSL